MQQKRYAISDRNLLLSLVLLAVGAAVLSAAIFAKPKESTARQPSVVQAATQNVRALPAEKAVEHKSATMVRDNFRFFSYDRSVVSGLKNMYLSLDHLELWIDEHPDSALKYVRYMPGPLQRNVAGIAKYIRSSNAKLSPKTVWREAAALVHYSQKYGVPMALVTAVAHAESTFNPNAVSPKGARGVMQVMWRIHNDLLASNGITGDDSDDPEKSVAAGCILLSRYIKAYGGVNQALDRYLGGFSGSYRNNVHTKVAKINTHIE